MPAPLPFRSAANPVDFGGVESLPPRAQLLVSVRDATEARDAVAGGADWIDVKEPTEGALGRAAPEVIGEIISSVGRLAPVTVALGELRDIENPQAADWSWLRGAVGVKVGLAGCATGASWCERLAELAQALPAGTRLVAVHYADWRTCHAPAAEEILAFAGKFHCLAFLVDTFDKQAGRLLDWLSPGELEQMFDAAKSCGLLSVAAGSLRREDFPRVLAARPDVVAVRSAACRESVRTETVCSARVGRLTDALAKEFSRIS